MPGNNIFFKIAKWFIPPSNYHEIAGSFFKFFLCFLTAILISLAIGFFYSKTSIANLHSIVKVLENRIDSLKSDSIMNKKNLSLLSEITNSDIDILSNKLKEVDFKDSAIRAIQRNLLTVIINYQTDRDTAKNQLQRIREEKSQESMDKSLEEKKKDLETREKTLEGKETALDDKKKNNDEIKNWQDLNRKLNYTNDTLNKRNDELRAENEQLRNASKGQSTEESKKNKKKIKKPIIPNPFKKRG